MADSIYNGIFNARCAQAWDDLQQALSDAEPACKGDVRFTLDSLSKDQQSELATICAGCPVLQQCDAFGDSIPKDHASSFWAGRARGRTPRQLAGAA